MLGKVKKMFQGSKPSELPELLKLDIGCGPNKKEGHLGVDMYEAEGIDIVIDIEKDRLPLEDNAVSHVFSNHAFEHINDPRNILREIVRVCRDKAVLEIWTPYLKSNDAFLLGHTSFYNENIWKHICILYDDFYFGETKGRLELNAFKYILMPGIEDQLKELNIPFSFALNHMFNISLEFAAMMTVDKNAEHADKNQVPDILVSYSRIEAFRAAKG